MINRKKNIAYLLVILFVLGFFCVPISFAIDSGSNASMIIILDASGSMWGQIDGKPKIAIAKDALAGIVKNLPENMNVGFVAYGHRKKGDCSDVEQLIPLSALNKKSCLKKLMVLIQKG